MIHILLSILLITPCLQATQAPYFIETNTPGAHIPPMPMQIIRHRQTPVPTHQRANNTTDLVTLPDAQTIYETHLYLHNEPYGRLEAAFLRRYAHQSVNRSTFNEDFNTHIAGYSRRSYHLDNNTTNAIRATLLYLLDRNTNR